MLIGYAHVSTADQKFDLQKDALTKAGCERIFIDTSGGARAERTGLEQALSFARKGDTVVVWKLDRLGRSLRHLVETLAALRERGIGFRSLQESIDTTTSGGKLVFHVFAALAEFERDLIRERTRAGLDAARARGKRGGRRPKLDDKKRAQAFTLHHDKSNTIDDICRTLRVGRSMLYRCLAQGCNIGLTRMAQISDRAYDRLAWCTTWYLREETLPAAVAATVNFQHRHPMSRHWGGGTLSSSDGQRFPVSGKVRNATALPRYFGYGRGVTFYTWTSDQFSRYGTKVIPATVRDAT
ncbi:MAG: recombinase family protein [Planctomycetaceae bacterium]|nr:recombinase family protein [Planctomycetaceae bacterium]